MCIFMEKSNYSGTPFRAACGGLEKRKQLCEDTSRSGQGTAVPRHPLLNSYKKEGRTVSKQPNDPFYNSPTENTDFPPQWRNQVGPRSPQQPSAPNYPTPQRIP